MSYPRHPICDSPFCQECRTGEGALLDFEHEIEEIVERPLTLEEQKIVEAYFETPYDEMYVALIILAVEFRDPQLQAVELLDQQHPSQTNYGAW